jgi:hypothetical protein
MHSGGKQNQSSLSKQLRRGAGGRKAQTAFSPPVRPKEAAAMSIPDPENFIAVQSRFELPLVRALDDYRRTLPEIRPRSEVVRLIVARSLGVEPEPRAVSGHPLRSRRPDAP